MRVLLLNPPSEQLVLRDSYCSTTTKADYYWPPVDLLAMSGTLATKHEVKVIDSNVNKASFWSAISDVVYSRPEVVIAMVSAISYEQDFKFLRHVKNNIQCKILVNGDIAYFEYKKVMEQYPFIDGIIMDFTSDEILKFLDGDKEAKTVVYRDGDKIVYKPLEKLKTFSYPVPRHNLFPLSKYRLAYSKSSPIVTMVMSLGCPYQCTFCNSGQLPAKYREIENVIDELRILDANGIHEIVFKDFTFTANMDHAKELCERIIEQKSTMDMAWSCATRVDRVNEELLKTMKKAGCYLIFFGVESAQEYTLKDVKKRMNFEQLKNAFKWCREIGIKTVASYVIGLPEETEEDINKTIEFSKCLGSDMASFNLYVPRVGTILRRELVNDGTMDDNDFSGLDSSTAGKGIGKVSPQRLLELQKKANREFYMRPSYLLRTLWSMRNWYEFTNAIKNGAAVLWRAR